jgi:preprotein translocase subunit YajC
LPGITAETLQMLQSYAPIVLMAVIFYFMLYRPQKKEQKKRAEMLNSLKKGDKVVTIGGMYGVITAINDKTVTLKVADKVELDFLRSAVSTQQNAG